VIAATIDSNGIEASVAQYRSLRTGNPNGFNFREAELSRLGAELLRQKKTNEAITVLKLNAEQYPQSFSVFDSLGDAYVAAGNTAEAMRNYQQSVTLFPDNQNSSASNSMSSTKVCKRTSIKCCRWAAFMLNAFIFLLLVMGGAILLRS